MKCLLSWVVCLCYLGSYKSPDVQKSLRKLQIPGEKTWHFMFYIPLGKERLFCILHLNNALCESLWAYSSPPTSAIIHYLVLSFIQREVKMLLLYHYYEIALSAKQGWKKVLKLKQSLCCWKFIFKTWRKKSLMLWFLTDIQILISGTSIVWNIKI